MLEGNVSRNFSTEDKIGSQIAANIRVQECQNRRRERHNDDICKGGNMKEISKAKVALSVSSFLPIIQNHLHSLKAYLLTEIKHQILHINQIYQDGNKKSIQLVMMIVRQLETENQKLRNQNKQLKNCQHKQKQSLKIQNKQQQKSKQDTKINSFEQNNKRGRKMSDRKNKCHLTEQLQSQKKERQQKNNAFQMHTYEYPESSPIFDLYQSTQDENAKNSSLSNYVSVNIQQGAFSSKQIQPSQFSPQKSDQFLQESIILFDAGCSLEVIEQEDQSEGDREVEDQENGQKDNTNDQEQKNTYFYAQKSSFQRLQSDQYQMDGSIHFIDNSRYRSLNICQPYTNIDQSSLRNNINQSLPEYVFSAEYFFSGECRSTSKQQQISVSAVQKPQKSIVCKLLKLSCCPLLSQNDKKLSITLPVLRLQQSTDSTLYGSFVSQQTLTKIDQISIKLNKNETDFKMIPSFQQETQNQSINIRKALSVLKGYSNEQLESKGQLRQQEGGNFWNNKQLIRDQNFINCRKDRTSIAKKRICSSQINTNNQNKNLSNINCGIRHSTPRLIMNHPIHKNSNKQNECSMTGQNGISRKGISLKGISNQVTNAKLHSQLYVQAGITDIWPMPKPSRSQLETPSTFTIPLRIPAMIPKKQ